MKIREMFKSVYSFKKNHLGVSDLSSSLMHCVKVFYAVNQ